MRVNEMFALEYCKRKFLKKNDDNYELSLETLVLGVGKTQKINSQSGGIFIIYCPPRVCVESTKGGIFYTSKSDIQTQNRLHEGSITISNMDTKSQTIEYLKFTK